MRTTQTFMISFFIRKKKNKPEEALLYARISVNGIYNEMSLKRSLEVSRWNQSACKLNGSSMESQQLNKKIDDTKALLYKAYDSLQKEDQFITASAVKSRYLGIDKKHYTLTQLLDYHSTKMKGVLKYGTLKPPPRSTYFIFLNFNARLKTVFAPLTKLSMLEMSLPE